MVRWCKECGAYIGLTEPVIDWTADRDSLCRWCETPEREPIDFDELTGTSLPPIHPGVAPDNGQPAGVGLS